MHDSVQNFIRRAILPEHIRGKRVLEVGSYNVNGSAREYVESLGPDLYLGIDLNEGPGVDRVVDITKIVTAEKMDVVITTEMLEHAKDWKAAIMNMKGLLTVGGMIILTTRSVGFGFHNEPDYWRYSLDDMRKIFADMSIEILEPDPQVPGVFVVARKISNEVADLSHITVEAVIKP